MSAKNEKRKCIFISNGSKDNKVWTWYIAYDLYKILIELRPEWAVKKVAADGVELSEKDKKELKPIEMLKLVMTRNKDDDKELFDMLGTKDDRKEFDRQFKNPKSNFKIAIVVDMWLTGFDVQRNGNRL